MSDQFWRYFLSVTKIFFGLSHSAKVRIMFSSTLTTTTRDDERREELEATATAYLKTIDF